MAWKYLIPLSLVNILVTGALKVTLWIKKLQLPGLIKGLGVTFRTC